MASFQKGQAVSVYYQDTDDDGNQVFILWFEGTYLTTENVGNGPELRIKRGDTGEHIHIRESSDDLRIVPEQ